MTTPLYVIHKCAMSLDGFIDDNGAARLVLSNDRDLDHLDAERALSDAILVGAQTVRRDNPRLMIRSEARIRERLECGRPEQPTMVTLTRAGPLEPPASCFPPGPGKKIVYCPQLVATMLPSTLDTAAEVVVAGEDRVDHTQVLRDLAERGVQRLPLEGGT